MHENHETTSATDVIPRPAEYLTDGGNVYFMHESALYTAPVMSNGSMGMEDAYPVGFDDGISEENQQYCKAIETALSLLAVRNRSEG